MFSTTTRLAGKKEIVFMGHIITAEGILPDPAKVEALQNLRISTDIIAVSRLCGTAQYLSRYSPNLSHHMEPLRALKRKNGVFRQQKRPLPPS